jgi:hypothetical protein
MIFRFLDIFFTVFHTFLILFNLAGWIWRKTRRLNLITLLLTGFSWALLGLLMHTLGYCPLTDWHFTILSRLGEANLPSSYIKYLIFRLTGTDISSEIIDRITLASFIISLIISVLLNARDYIRKHKEP